jgi:hypothetical protein
LHFIRGTSGYKVTKEHIPGVKMLTHNEILGLQSLL